MANLLATAPLGHVKPITHAQTTCAQMDWVQITSIAPFAGREGAVSAALGRLGLGFPAPNTFASKGDARIAWTGRGQAFLFGADCPDLGDAAAVTDQSDAWARFSLAGPASVEVLARLVPIDLRLCALPVGASIRSQLYHVPLCLLRLGPDDFELLVFRSMAQTAWHEIGTALKALAARG
ncbi:MAG: sarcosine oxidase subunit gamma [Cypionkella sp.]|nr:sarcosine oxidase subunit gamma [Cypionkella sp.]